MKLKHQDSLTDQQEKQEALLNQKILALDQEIDHNEQHIEKVKK